MAKTQRIQVPGEPQAPGALQINADAEALAGASERDPGFDDKGSDSEGGTTDTEALLAQLAEAKRENERLRRAQKTAAAHPDSVLPEQSSVNPERIKQPVLTRDGWVTPVSFTPRKAA